MADGPTLLADTIVPEIFSAYSLLQTEEKSRLIRSGAVVGDAELAALLNGGGLTFQMRTWDDLDNDDENIADESLPINLTAGVADPIPKKIGSIQEVAARMERNQSWSATTLAKLLSGADPAGAIANRVADYWIRRQQTAFVATMTGIFADNALAVGGGGTHVQNDMTVDITGASYSAGVTDFSAESFIDATLTMGDSMEDLTMVMMHSIVYSRAQKNNLIDFIPDASGVINIPTFLGREVIVDDGLPGAGGIYESWMFGAGAVLFGQGSPDVPTEVQRQAGAGNGNGLDVLWNRVRWGFHPKGHAYVATPPSGGPTNTQLAAAANWERRFPERKQIKIARLITRES